VKLAMGGQTPGPTNGHVAPGASKFAPDAPTTLDALRTLAAEITPFDRLGAARLRSLGDSIESQNAHPDWTGMDVLHVVDAASIGNVIRSQPLYDDRLASEERWRNVLVLFPIFLTWFGLFIASAGYRTAIEADRALVERPFLLLWEQGFEGHLKFPWSLLSWLSLSTVAMFDVAVLVVIVILTWRIHSTLNVRQVDVERRAHDIEHRLTDALWSSSLLLAPRTVPSAAADHLGFVAQSVLDHMRAEREQIRLLNTERETEIASFKDLVGNLRVGADNLALAGQQIASSVELLARVAEELKARAVARDQTDQKLEQALQTASNTLEGLSTKQADAMKQMEQTAKLLNEAAERDVQATVQVGQSVGQLQTELSDLQRHLVNERQAYQRAGEQATMAAGALQRAAELAVAAADRAATSAGEAASAAGMAATSAERSAASIHGVLGEFQASSQNLGSASQGQIEAARSLSSSAQRISDAEGQTNEQLARAAGSLTTSADGLTRAASGMESLGRNVAELARQAQSMASALGVRRRAEERWWSRVLGRRRMGP
jgi:hypothetical protein